MCRSAPLPALGLLLVAGVLVGLALAAPSALAEEHGTHDEPGQAPWPRSEALVFPPTTGEDGDGEAPVSSADIARDLGKRLGFEPDWIVPEHRFPSREGVAVRATWQTESEVRVNVTRDGNLTQSWIQPVSESAANFSGRVNATDLVPGVRMGSFPAHLAGPLRYMEDAAKAPYAAIVAPPGTLPAQEFPNRTASALADQLGIPALDPGDWSQTASDPEPIDGHLYRFEKRCTPEGCQDNGGKVALSCADCWSLSSQRFDTTALPEELRGQAPHWLNRIKIAFTGEDQPVAIAVGPWLDPDRLDLRDPDVAANETIEQLDAQDYRVNTSLNAPRLGAAYPDPTHGLPVPTYEWRLDAIRSPHIDLTRVDEVRVLAHAEHPILLDVRAWGDNTVSDYDPDPGEGSTGDDGPPDRGRVFPVDDRRGSWREPLLDSASRTTGDVAWVLPQSNLSRSPSWNLSVRPLDGDRIQVTVSRKGIHVMDWTHSGIERVDGAYRFGLDDSSLGLREAYAPVGEREPGFGRTGAGEPFVAMLLPPDAPIQGDEPRVWTADLAERLGIPRPDPGGFEESPIEGPVRLYVPEVCEGSACPGGRVPVVELDCRDCTRLTYRDLDRESLPGGLDLDDRTGAWVNRFDVVFGPDEHPVLVQVGPWYDLQATEWMTLTSAQTSLEGYLEADGYRIEEAPQPSGVGAVYPYADKGQVTFPLVYAYEFETLSRNATNETGPPAWVLQDGVTGEVVDVHVQPEPAREEGARDPVPGPAAGLWLVVLAGLAGVARGRPQ